jgi:SPP1 gp7 family putative phage head morphogenesis protein
MLDKMRLGLISGVNPRDIGRAMAQAGLVPLRRGQTISRTEMIRAWRRSTEANYTANSHIVEEWIWYTSRDDRVCIACAVLDGTTYPVNEVLDPHVQCRCTMLPKLKNVPMDFGPTAIDWLDEQPYDVRKAIVGKKKLELVENGVIEYRDIQTWQTHELFGKSPAVRSIPDSIAAAQARRGGFMN